jgi:hypothetical protein
MRLRLISVLQSALLVTLGGLTSNILAGQERSRTEPARVDVTQLLPRMEADADAFEDKFEETLDSSNVNGTRLEAELNRMADIMEDSIDNMQKHHRGNDTQKASASLEDALISASGVNRFLLRRDMTGANTEWQKLREDLNQVAKAYHRPVLPDVTVSKLVPVTADSLSKPELKLTMEKIEAASDRFEQKFEDSIQHSTANMTAREEMFEWWGEALEDATDEMLDEFKDGDTEEFAHELEHALVVAEVINRIMAGSDLFKDAHLQWNELREELNTAAVAFGQPVLSKDAVSTRAGL